MKIKPSTLALVLVALGLGGIVLLVQQQPAPQSSNSEAGEQVVSEEEKPIFGFKEEDIQAFTLQTRLRTLRFERDKDGKWQMLEPEKTAASDPSIAFLLDLVATGKTQRTITAPASDREQFGLHQPLATIDLTLKDQKTHKLVIGEYDFNRSFLYAQADPPAEATDSLNLLLVSPNFDNAVNRPLDEWKQPATAGKSSPAPASPKASPQTSPAASPSPNPAASESPSN
ncbi:DUF4340 domain-containing protein [Leptolyngbya sp. NK1-12]|uniref:DUF4340 domain-containing protein n=1 Tax=Leptolyngbya sp. NK1-12 TaxID=2547451 RepID=A0AA97AJV4_9CYAN|nr:DUF4340 domain-containing protein [Leptolyngbya sp. NK1-12]